MSEKAKLFQIQGVAVLIVIIGYVGLTAYALIRWNDIVSASLVTGFVLFAQSTAHGFFDWLNSGKNGNGHRTADGRRRSERHKVETTKL
jgi:nicotinamide riboside transporter PnuC